MSYTYFANDDQVTLINITNGIQTTMSRADKNFDTFKDAIIAGRYEDAEKMNTKLIVQNFALSNVSSGFGVTIENGIGKVSIRGQEYSLADSITDRICRMAQEGFSAQPLVNFLENLYQNPSKTAIDELFLFLDQTTLPITTDGHFIAYKIVSNEYRDIYTGKFDNSIGKVCEMPRFEVDDKRDNVCSNGLHFCSRNYLVSYGSSNRNTDRCVLIKINPKDVVSIPSDYNNAKGRTCRYEVVGEVTDNQWRKVLSERDYNESSVIQLGFDIDTLDDAFDDNFYVNDFSEFCWNDSHRHATWDQVFDRLKKRTHVVDNEIESFMDEKLYEC